MRIKRTKTDYEAISRRSIKRDFYPEQIHMKTKRNPENEKSSQITKQSNGDIKRIASINPNCQYARYARYFVGKMVRLISKAGEGNSTTGWYDFVYDDDRKALNQVAGWSDNKNMYLLEGPIFK